jgi:hypothetical protein
VIAGDCTVATTDAEGSATPGLPQRVISGHTCGSPPTEGEAEFIALDMRPGRVQMAAGVFGTVPLYLVTTGDELRGAWDLAELRSRLRADRLAPHVMARTLSRQYRYSMGTLFEGVYRLTERDGRLHIGGTHRHLP